MIKIRNMTKTCYCIKLFRSLQYSLSKIICVKLPDILVNLGVVSIGQNRNLTGNHILVNEWKLYISFLSSYTELYRQTYRPVY